MVCIRAALLWFLVWLLASWARAACSGWIPGNDVENGWWGQLTQKHYTQGYHLDYWEHYARFYIHDIKVVWCSETKWLLLLFVYKEKGVVGVFRLCAGGIMLSCPRELSACACLSVVFVSRTNRRCKRPFWSCLRHFTYGHRKLALA